jgi:putative iron-dependent peroxidase
MMGEEASEAVLIGQADPGFAGDRYVMVQRYLNDRNGWNALTTDAQELSAGLTLRPASPESNPAQPVA